MKLRQSPWFCEPLGATALLMLGACTGEIISPTTPAPAPSGQLADRACPTMIADQPTTMCPRLKNISLTCGGNGMLHTSVSGGSGAPIVLGATLDNGSVLSAVLVVVNCQDGPRESVTFGVDYTGQVSIPQSGPPCISQSKAAYSQFQFGNPAFAPLEGAAKDKLHETLDEQTLAQFAGTVGLAAATPPRCSFWRPMP